jgi:hypothetical protein
VILRRIPRSLSRESCTISFHLDFMTLRGV